MQTDHDPGNPFPTPPWSGASATVTPFGLASPAAAGAARNWDRTRAIAWAVTSCACLGFWAGVALTVTTLL